MSVANGTARRFARSLPVMLALLVATMGTAWAAPGDLDTSFSVDGKVTSDLTLRSDGAYGAALQADGKIVAVGWANYGGGHSRFGVARYNTDGSLDTTFSGDGKVMTAFTRGDDEAVSVAIQTDGKIVVAGGAGVSTSDAKFAVARYNTDGSLDTTFSGDGRVITNLTLHYDEATGVAIQTDGKIVVAGGERAATAWAANFAVVRYNTDGSLDATFNGDGKVTTDFGKGFEYVSGMAIQADGKIVASGQAQADRANPKAALARYNTNGALDTTFSGDGKLLSDFTTSGPDGEFGVAIQADGKIMGAGEAGGANPKFAVVRYNSDGTLDTTFSGDGKVFTDFTSKWDFADSVLIQGDGNIVAVGAAGGINPKFALARYLAA